MRAWWNDYTGIPYLAKGRTRQGADCYGLARLVHKEVFNHILPSYVEEYDDRDPMSIQTAILNHQENWVEIDQKDVKSGDLVLFDVLGLMAHVGIFTESGFFLHVFDGLPACVCELGDIRWRNRIKGFYRYTEILEGEIVDKTIRIHAITHPLRSDEFDVQVPQGMNLKELDRWVKDRSDLPYGLLENLISGIQVNGVPVSPELWEHIVPDENHFVAYVIVPGGDEFWGGLIRLSSAIAGTFLSQIPVVGPLLGIGVSLLGNFAAEALFAVRPNQGPEFTQGRQLYLINNSSNQAEQYGPYPLVFGKTRVRGIPGIKTYVDNTGDDSYLHMVLVWCAAPAIISDIRIGETNIYDFEDVEVVTLDGIDTPETIADFNELAGQDTDQVIIGLSLDRPLLKVTSMTDMGSYYVVITENDHNYLVGTDVSFCATQTSWTQNDPHYTVSEIVNSTTFKFNTTAAGLNFSFCHGSNWLQDSLDETVTRLSFGFSFNGLRGIASDTGASFDWPFGARVEVQNTLPTPGSFFGLSTTVRAKTFNTIGIAWANTDSDAALEKVYQWHRVVIAPDGSLKLKSGCFTNNWKADPTEPLLSRLIRTTASSSTATFKWLPELEDGEVEIWRVPIYGNTVSYFDGDNATRDHEDLRGTSGFTIVGCGLTFSANDRTFTVAGGTIGRTSENEINIGGPNQRYASHGDPFNYNYNPSLPEGKYNFKILRTTPSSTFDTDSAIQVQAACKIEHVTGFYPAKPMNPLKKLCMSAIKIKSNSQLNGNIEPITALVQVLGEEWDPGTSSWVLQPTRNAISMAKLAVKHPLLSSPLTESDLVSIDWQSAHAYAKSKGMNYDEVRYSKSEMGELLRDILSAARAKPITVENKLGIAQERPTSTVTLMISTANAWDFEIIHKAPNLPHAFRCIYVNERASYKVDEMLVYADGYSDGTVVGTTQATIFQEYQPRGVVNPDRAFLQSRFMMAQMKLRPATYTCKMMEQHLNARVGALVSYAHPGQLHSIGTGRILERVTGTKLKLNTKVTFAALTTYEITIEQLDGTQILRTVQQKVTAGDYDEIDLTVSVTADQADLDFVFAFGNVSSSVKMMRLIDKKNEKNGSARLILQDYVGDELFNVDDDEIDAYDPQITLPPDYMAPVITQTPIFVGPIDSGTNSTRRSADGIFTFGISVPIRHPVGLSGNVSGINYQIKPASDTSLFWPTGRTVGKNRGSIFFSGVQENQYYVMSIRYASAFGTFGPRLVVGLPSGHRVVGRNEVPPPAAGMNFTFDGDKAYVNWIKKDVVDFGGFELRDSNPSVLINGTNTWGGSGYLYKGSSLRSMVIPAAAGVTKTFYLRQFDVLKKYSTVISLPLTVSYPPAITTVTQTEAKISVGLVNLTLDWGNVVGTTFPILEYEVRQENPAFPNSWANSVFKWKGAQSITTINNVSNTGTTKFLIKAKDVRGNYSASHLLVTHDSTPPGSLASATVTVTQSGRYLRMSVTGTGTTSPEGDLECYEWRIARIVSGSTTGDNAIDGSPSSATDQQLWDDPDTKYVRNLELTSLTLFDLKKFTNGILFSTAGVVYKVLVAKRDKSGNYGIFHSSVSVTVKRIT